MEQRTYKTKQEVLIRGQEAIGKTLARSTRPGVSPRVKVQSAQ